MMTCAQCAYYHISSHNPPCRNCLHVPTARFTSRKYTNNFKPKATHQTRKLYQCICNGLVTYAVAVDVEEAKDLFGPIKEFHIIEPVVFTESKLLGGLEL